MRYKIISLVFFGLLCCWALPALAQPFANTPRFLKTNLHPKQPVQQLAKATRENLQAWHSSLKALQAKLRLTKEEYQKELQTTIKRLNSLRNVYYQNQVYWIAQSYLGKNIYHDFASGDKQTNEETNTCANGWCQIMAETTIPALQALATGQIKFLIKTIHTEKTKYRPNLSQKKPKYIHVNDIMKNAESLGFLPIDLDLAQRGDFSIQYYRHPQRDNKFAAQHISIVDVIIARPDGGFELRDWHEGIEGYPFLYRTGFNLPNSHNNIFLPENVYYGYQNERGKERPLKGKNPNVSQAYAYFGYLTEQAKPLIKQINAVREQIRMVEEMEKDLLAKM